MNIFYNIKLFFKVPKILELLKLQNHIINNILTDSQLDIRLNCGKSIREYSNKMEDLMETLK